VEEAKSEEQLLVLAGLRAPRELLIRYKLVQSLHVCFEALKSNLVFKETQKLRKWQKPTRAGHQTHTVLCDQFHENYAAHRSSRKQLAFIY